LARWENWSGKVVGRPTQTLAVRGESEIVDAVRAAAQRSQGVRCVGAAHSHSALVVTDGTLLDLAALDGVIDIDGDAGEVTLAAGTRISEMGAPLREAGLALRNQGDIDRQSIAGAVATGTHGTGPRLQNLSASVVGARLVLADGRVVDCDAQREPELFQIARLSLGAVGVVTRLRLAVRDAYRLAERMWFEELDAVLDRIEELTTETRHFEFFWLPGKPKAACKALEETTAPAEYPLAAEGSRVAWSYEVLANDRPDKHTEMEYSLPARHGPACLRALRERIARDYPELAWPLEYRTLAADEVWLSSAYQRPTVTISVHQGVDLEDEALFRACEEIFREFDGRPHWGKVHYLDGAQLGKIHARWSDWWEIRNRFDPQGVFLNPLLRSFAPNP
jgi:FAD/FMN-containing dehydrogenase